MESIFDNARFGDKYVTRSGKEALFLRYAVNAEYNMADLYVKDWGQVRVHWDCGVEVHGYTDQDIVGKMEEPKGLDEAAEEYSKHLSTGEIDGRVLEKMGFKAGAKWMAEQGYSSEAVVGGVTLPDGEYRKVANFCSQSIRVGMDNLNLSKGDKVIVQIRKQEKID